MRVSCDDAATDREETERIPARGSGGSGVPVLGLANALSAGARVFIHDPTNLWWYADRPATG